MKKALDKIYDEAIQCLTGLVTKQGLFASTIQADNYKRVWARDSIICGIAGMLSQNNLVIEGLKSSLLTLAKNQHQLGIIPSNVFNAKNKKLDVSYGNLVGRVDSNTWFNIGVCLYYLNTKDETFWQQLQPALQKSRAYLNTIEFNGKGWIYTPLSGNWADEYPIHGYTLYDNSLRIWGESLWCKINNKTSSALDFIKEKTYLNFWPQKGISSKYIYQKRLFEDALKEQPHYFFSSILPGKYNKRFDAAGNALALMNFKISNSQKESLSVFVTHIKSELDSCLIPAFWPVIKEDNKDWNLLKDNYSYSFKNKPYTFQNGGIWPVWMGLFCLGLAHNNLNKTCRLIVEDFLRIVSQQNWNFQEYITSDTLQLSGKEQMGFTASGIVFMYHALKNNAFKNTLGL